MYFVDYLENWNTKKNIKIIYNHTIKIIISDDILEYSLLIHFFCIYWDPFLPVWYNKNFW